MDSHYLLHEPSTVFSPGLLFYRDVIRHNIAKLIARVGDPARLRPHVKTHKTREIVQMELQAGITKHKCATIAEAEMLAGVGVPDVLLAYNLVGPNHAAASPSSSAISRTADFRPSPIIPSAAQAAVRRAGADRAHQADVLLDLDVGQHRTGIAAGAGRGPALRDDRTSAGPGPGGLHVYDGHNHQHTLEERRRPSMRLLDAGPGAARRR